jgi:hypothetical protein
LRDVKSAVEARRGSFGSSGEFDSHASAVTAADDEDITLNSLHLACDPNISFWLGVHARLGNCEGPTAEESECAGIGVTNSTAEPQYCFGWLTPINQTILLRPPRTVGGPGVVLGQAYRLICAEKLNSLRNHRCYVREVFVIQGSGCLVRRHVEVALQHNIT